MTFLDEQLKDLEDEFKVTKESKEQLKSEILRNAHIGNRRNIKHYKWIAVPICVLFIITTPLYSPAMANLVSKLLPLSITSSFSENRENVGLTSQLTKLVQNEGYTVNSIGITPSPFTIDISLILENSTIEQAKDDLKPTIINYLHENGYDYYILNISKATVKDTEGNKLYEDSNYDKVSEIVKEVFSSYGYAEEADYELAGLKHTSSYILTVDMPDHIKESDEIIADIEKEIKTQNLDIEGIEVSTFNFENRRQDNRWAYVASDLYDAMAGKRSYKVNGITHTVKKGHSYVSIETDLNTPPSKDNILEITTAIEEYLATSETKKQIQKDDYTIQLLLKDGTPFVKVTNIN